MWNNFRRWLVLVLFWYFFILHKDVITIRLCLTFWFPNNYFNLVQGKSNNRNKWCLLNSLDRLWDRALIIDAGTGVESETCLEMLGIISGGTRPNLEWSSCQKSEKEKKKLRSQAGACVHGSFSSRRRRQGRVHWEQWGDALSAACLAVLGGAHEALKVCLWLKDFLPGPFHIEPWSHRKVGCHFLIFELVFKPHLFTN